MTNPTATRYTTAMLHMARIYSSTDLLGTDHLPAGPNPGYD